MGKFSLAESSLRAPAVFLNALPMLGLLLAVAYLAIAVRYLVLIWSPWLGHHASVISTILDAAFGLISVLFHTIVPIVVDIINIVASVVKAVSYTHLTLPTILLV